MNKLYFNFKDKSISDQSKKVFDLNTFSFLMPFLKNITKNDLMLKSLIKIKKGYF